MICSNGLHEGSNLRTVVSSVHSPARKFIKEHKKRSAICKYFPFCSLYWEWIKRRGATVYTQETLVDLWPLLWSSGIFIGQFTWWFKTCMESVFCSLLPPKPLCCLLSSQNFCFVKLSFEKFSNVLFDLLVTAIILVRFYEIRELLMECN